MTRPDKHAARFGDRYQPLIDWRRFRKAVDAGLPFRPFHPGGRYRPDILDRIDDTLLTYDAQRSTGEPWPYRGF